MLVSSKHSLDNLNACHVVRVRSLLPKLKLLVSSVQLVNSTHKLVVRNVMNVQQVAIKHSLDSPHVMRVQRVLQTQHQHNLNVHHVHLVTCPRYLVLNSVKNVLPVVCSHATETRHVTCVVLVSSRRTPRNLSVNSVQSALQFVTPELSSVMHVKLEHSKNPSDKQHVHIVHKDDSTIVPKQRHVKHVVSEHPPAPSGRLHVAPVKLVHSRTEKVVLRASLVQSVVS